MTLRDTRIAALVLLVASVAAAQAQMADFPPVGQRQSSGFPPVGQQASPFPPPGAGQGFPGFGQPQQKPPCYDEFMALREAMDKRFAAVQAKMGKANAGEMCTLLTKFGQAQTALLKFVEPNMAKCGFPQEAPSNMKDSLKQTEGYRKQACAAAAAPKARSTEPTLSDTLSPPAFGKDNTKTGSGTLDSLFGNPLAR